MIINGSALDILSFLDADQYDCCVTSPPYYGLRDYGVVGQIGLEDTPEEYIAGLVAVFREVRRVLKPSGTLWVNIGDTYAANRGYQVPDGKYKDVGNGKASRVPSGLKQKDLYGIPWMLAFALRADGWYLRADIIWHKPNVKPESVTDRPTRSHEYLFLLTRSQKYLYNAAAIAEPTVCNRMRGPALHGDLVSTNGNSGLSRRGISQTRNKRTVWSINTTSLKEAHFAAFPLELPRTCISAGCPETGSVLDPFCGAGTTWLAAKELGREFVGIELNPEYCVLAEKRVAA